jgi:hypothetical protein
MEIVNRVLLEDKIYEMFEEAFNQMEDKFKKDYDELRNLSIMYTEMYHDVNDNMIPQIYSLEENSTIYIANSNVISIKDDNSASNDRSKTPVKFRGGATNAYANKPMKNEEFKLANKRENDSTPIKNERSRTPVMAKPKSNTNNINSNSNKKEIDNKIIGSIQSVTIKNVDDSFAGGKKTNDQVDSAIMDSKDFSKNTKAIKDMNSKQGNIKEKVNNQVQVQETPPQHDQKKRNSKQTKAIPSKNEGKARDLTPVANNKKIKNILDISTDDIKNEGRNKEINSYNANAKNANNLRNNQKHVTINNQKNENIKKNKRHTAIDIVHVSNLLSKKSMCDNKNFNNNNMENSAKRSESDEEKKENPVILNEFTKVETKIIKEIEVPMKKKEFVFSSNSVECLFILANSE